MMLSSIRVRSRVLCMQELSPLEVSFKTLRLPIKFARQANVESGSMELVTQHGGWQARVIQSRGRYNVSGVPAALMSELQRSTCSTISLTLLRPGRVLISTEGEAQHSAVVADEAQRAAEHKAGDAAEPLAKMQLSPPAEGELVADASRISCLKVSILFTRKAYISPFKRLLRTAVFNSTCQAAT